MILIEKNALFCLEKSLKITIHLHCLIPQKSEERKDQQSLTVRSMNVNTHTIKKQ